MRIACSLRIRIVLLLLLVCVCSCGTCVASLHTLLSLWLAVVVVPSHHRTDQGGVNARSAEAAGLPDLSFLIAELVAALAAIGVVRCSAAASA